MAYNKQQQPQQPDKPKKQQRPLSPAELEQASAWTKRWTPEQLSLIWRKKMPVDASMEDLQLFLYACEAKDLDPLLSEVYCRLQFDRELGEKRLLILDSIHGMLKSADKTKELNGTDTTFETDKDGLIVSATATVYRKNCQFPFRATAYFYEYNAGTYIWTSKPHVMLGKCALALALRLAFAAALAGVYTPEELEHGDRPEPESDFVVGEISDTETVPRETPAATVEVVQPEPQRLSPDVPVEATKVVSEADEKAKAKAANAALVQRIMGDLDVDKGLRQSLLTDFYLGFLGVTELPKDPRAFTAALEALGFYADAERKARQMFMSLPKELGQNLSAIIATTKETVNG